MAPKRRQPAPTSNFTPVTLPPPRAFTRSFLSRAGLGAYLDSPTSFPQQVLYHNEHFVAINDLYPKSSVHTLLLPCSATHTLQHPTVALADAPFLASIRAEIPNLVKLVATELRRRYGQYSVKEKARREAMERGAPKEELPIGRDWEAEVMVGMHAGPSMDNLHIHVLSRDRFSECLKRRKHYNSFATEFLVKLNEFPLTEGEVHKRCNGLRADLVCWRCGKNFGNKMARLKEHLAEEFEAWKRE